MMSMVYSLEKITEDVRRAIDHNSRESLLIEEEDEGTLDLSEMVASKVLEGVRRIELAAPAYLLEEGHNFGDAIYWCDRGSGRIGLPDDFMRLITFKMSDWDRAVFDVITPSDPRYALQSSRSRGIRGNVQRPIVAIVNMPWGKALEFYSCKSNEATVERATYLPYPEIDCTGGVDISERCYEAVIYQISALVLISYGQSEQAANLQAMAQSLAGITHGREEGDRG